MTRCSNPDYPDYTPTNRGGTTRTVDPDYPDSLPEGESGVQTVGVEAVVLCPDQGQPRLLPLTDREVTDLRRRMCGGKRALGIGEARRAACRMRRQGHPVSQYPCCWCHCWHVGHPPGMHTVRMLARYLRFGEAS